MKHSKYNYAKKSGKKNMGKKSAKKNTSKKSARKNTSKKNMSKKEGKENTCKKAGKENMNSSSNKDNTVMKEYIYKKLFNKNIKKSIELMEKSLNKKYKPFIKIDDIDNELDYVYEKNNNNLGLHIGQRKLLLSEVQFLTNNRQKYCIYVGAAPSHKTHFLAELFPDIKFILIDPNIFEIKIVENNELFRKHKHKDIIMLYYGFPTKSLTYGSNKILDDMDDTEISEMIQYIEKSDHKIYIIEDYMTDKLAIILKKLGVCNFMSDIRTNVTNKQPIDFDVIWNRSMVHNWISMIQPEMSMIKFRIPYYNSKENFNQYDFAKEHFETSKKFGIDFIENYNNKIFRISKATLYLQAWAGQTSTEMRGWIDKKDINNIIEYDLKKIESILFYYNKITRCAYHINKHANKKLCLCNCNDCAIESTIWNDYINLVYLKYPKIDKNKTTIEYYIKLTNKLTSRPLDKKHNNTIYEPLTIEKLASMVSKKNNSTEYGDKINRGNTGIRK